MNTRPLLRRIAKYATIGFCLLLTTIIGGMVTVDYVLSNKNYPAAEHAPDWNVAGHEQIVSIVTFDPEGDSRTTPLWLVTVDGEPYLRTSNTKWYSNLEREPSLLLRSGGKAYRYIAAFVRESDLKARVHKAFNAKYPLRTKMFEALGQNPLRMQNIIRLVWAGGL